MSFYASDILEPLLEASAVRSAVRDHCIGLLDASEQPLRERLMPAAHYVGGKCMGYAAIWLLERMLGPRGITLGLVIRHAEPALSISLTTSIVDDLVDRDELITAEYVAFLYVLIAHASFEDRAAPAGGAHGKRALLDQALDVCIDPNGMGGGAVRRGNRIGHFYRMIATGPARAFLPDKAANAAIEATGRFGEFCAHVDDWLDLERDREQGIDANVALALLRKRGKAQVAGARIDHREMGWLRVAMSDFLNATLGEIRSTIASLDMPLATASLDRVAMRVPEMLLLPAPHARRKAGALDAAHGIALHQIFAD